MSDAILAAVITGGLGIIGAIVGGSIQAARFPRPSQNPSTADQSSSQRADGHPHRVGSRHVLAGLALGLLVGLVGGLAVASRIVEPAPSLSLGPTATPTPTPAPTPTPTPIATPKPNPPAGCITEDLGELLTGRKEFRTDPGYINVEYWTPGQPERDVILPVVGEVVGYRWNDDLRGWAWWYSEGCSSTDVSAEVQQHIEDRLRDGENNVGRVVDWESTGIFTPIGQ